MLKARKSENKCEICWQSFKKVAQQEIITYQNKRYHKYCFDKKFKVIKKAEHKKASHKKSL